MRAIQPDRRAPLARRRGHYGKEAGEGKAGGEEAARDQGKWGNYEG